MRRGSGCVVELGRNRIDGTIAGTGVTVATVAPGRLWLVSGVSIAPNTVDGGLYWLAPDRVLAVGDVAEGAFVSEVTDGFVVLDVVGAAWTAVLSMASTLAPETLGAGRCAQTVFAGLTLLIAGRDDGMRIFVERPLAAWLLDWLRQAVTSLV